VQSTQSTVCTDPAVIAVRARLTDSRTEAITVPLGRVRSTGALETRPLSTTPLSASTPLSTTELLVM